MTKPTREELSLLADGDDVRLIEDVRRELTPGVIITCPGCRDELDYEPPYREQPDIGISEWPGGYVCQCGFKRLDDRPLTDADLI